MPPRYAYWTIIADELPTAFRARERDDLLPVLKRLQAQHPDAELKWFSQGTLWESPEAASKSRAAASAERRSKAWRPGGSHRDPRQTFIDQKKRKNQARRQVRWQRRTASEGAPRRKSTPDKS